MKRLIVFLAACFALWFAGGLITGLQSVPVERGLLISPVYAQELLLGDDFEKGELKGWGPAKDLALNWEVKKIGTNSFLSGKGGAFIYAGNSKTWKDYSFKIKAERVKGGFELSFRSSAAGRYFVSLNDTRNLLILKKSKTGGNVVHLIETALKLDTNKWYAFNIVAKGPNIKVFVDEALKIDYTDTDPILNGSIQLIALEGSEVHFDDIKIESSAI